MRRLERVTLTTVLPVQQHKGATSKLSTSLRAGPIRFGAGCACQPKDQQGNEHATDSRLLVGKQIAGNIIFETTHPRHESARTRDTKLWNGAGGYVLDCSLGRPCNITTSRPRALVKSRAVKSWLPVLIQFQAGTVSSIPSLCSELSMLGNFHPTASTITN